jgi:hypothetical protein
MDVHEWLDYGMTMGYCMSPVCDTHEGVELTPGELAEFEEGLDPCVSVVRFFAD